MNQQLKPFWRTAMEQIEKDESLLLCWGPGKGPCTIVFLVGEHFSRPDKIKVPGAKVIKAGFHTLVQVDLSDCADMDAVCAKVKQLIREVQSETREFILDRMI